MVEENLEGKINKASLESFALTLHDLTARAVGEELAGALRARVTQNTVFMHASRSVRDGMHIQDKRDDLVNGAVFIGGVLIKEMVESGRVRSEDLIRLSDRLLKDGDVVMDIIDLCRERGINDQAGWGQVYDLNNRFVARMVGDVYTKDLMRRQEEALQKEGPQSLHAYSIGGEIAIIGWMPLEYRAPKGRGH